jgi:short subunit fatty acids transporter
MKMHLLVCTLAMLFTKRCCNMIVQTIELNKAFVVVGVRSHGLPTSYNKACLIA